MFVAATYTIAMTSLIPKGHETSLQHDGVLQRWCPVQEDVEAYFRTTLDKVCNSHLEIETPS